MRSKSIHSLNSGADVVCLQFDVRQRIAYGKIISQKLNKNETDNKAFLHSIVWHNNKIIFHLAEMPGQSVRPG